MMELLNYTGLSAHGLVVGFIASFFSLLWRINGLDWKTSVVVIFGGGLLSGYLLPVLLLKVSKPIGHIVSFVAGFISYDIFYALKKAGPAIGSSLVNKTKKVISDD